MKNLKQTQEYKHVKHEFVRLDHQRKPILASGRAESALRKGHEGHHSSAYSLTPAKVQKMLSSMNQESLQNYQNIYANFKNELELLNRNYETYLIDNILASKTDSELNLYKIDANAYNKPKEGAKPLAYLQHELSYSKITIDDCLAFTQNIIEQGKESQKESRREANTSLNKLNSPATERRLAKKNIKQLDKELCNIYAEMIICMANEYIIQKSRQYYASFIREGNIDPPELIAHSYSEPNYITRKRNFESIENEHFLESSLIGIPEHELAQSQTKKPKSKAESKSKEVSSSTSASHSDLDQILESQAEKVARTKEPERIKNAKIYLNKYAGEGKSKEEREITQMTEEHLKDAAHATIDLFYYPLVPTKTIYKDAVYISSNGESTTEIEHGSVIYKKIPGINNKYERKYALGVFSRDNDLRVASLVVMEHLQNVFSCYKTIIPQACEAIYESTVKNFTESWKLDEEGIKIFSDNLDRYKKPWSGFNDFSAAVLEDVSQGPDLQEFSPLNADIDDEDYSNFDNENLEVDTPNIINDAVSKLVTLARNFLPSLTLNGLANVMNQAYKLIFGSDTQSAANQLPTLNDDNALSALPSDAFDIEQGVDKISSSPKLDDTIISNKLKIEQVAQHNIASQRDAQQQTEYSINNKK